MSNRSSVPTPALVVLLGLLLVGIGFQVYQKRAAAAGALGYGSDWAAALEESKASGKPILLNFGGSW